MSQTTAKVNSSPTYIILFCVFFLLLTGKTCFALTEDRTQIMEVHARSADLNHQTHRGIYSGDVEVDQGSTHIRAAEAITEGNLKNQLVKAIIKGNRKTQAHYWALTAADKPPMHAYADTINYYPGKHLIELIGNARVEQGNNSFSAPHISYDTIHQHVISKGNGQEQTTIIIYPGKHP